MSDGGRLRACVGVASAVLGLAAAAEGVAGVPRYSLPVGRELTYVSTEEYHPVGEPRDAEEAQGRAETAREIASRVEVARLTVVGENADGSRRVVEQVGRYRRGTGGRPEGEASRVELRRWDVFPDGRIATYWPLGRLPLLGPLPPERADVARGWVGSSTQPGESFACVPRAPGSGGGGEFVFGATEQGTVTSIDGGDPRRAVYHFDRARGVVTSCAFEYGSVETDNNRLDLDRVLAPAELKAVAADFDRFFAASDRYDALMERAERSAGRVDAILDEARGVVAAAWVRATQGVTRGQLAEVLRQHDERRAKYAREAAARLADLLGHPAADWASADLDGRPVKLSDFRGKVVVMDFWYRRCGWCEFAMPQVKQLAEDFKGRPVVVLGMSVDEDEKDARVVAGVMKFPYPTVKAHGINDKYGFHAFPALLVVDQGGVVRAFHDRYSPTLRLEVGTEVEGLLRGGKAGGG